MQTKAELEAQISALQLRVEYLEGKVAAYELALSMLPKQFAAPTDNTWWWNSPVFPTPVANPNTTFPIVVTS